MKNILILLGSFFYALFSNSLFGMLPALKSSSESPFNIEQFVKAFNSGQEFFNNRNYAEAQICFDQAIRCPGCPDSMKPCIQLRLAHFVAPEIAVAYYQDIIQNQPAEQITIEAALGLIKNIGKKALENKNYRLASAAFVFITRSPKAYPQIVAASHMGLTKIAIANNDLKAVYDRTSIILRMYHQNQKVSDAIVFQSLETHYNIGCVELKNDDNGCETTFKGILSNEFMKLPYGIFTPYSPQRAELQLNTLQKLAEFCNNKRRRKEAAGYNEQAEKIKEFISKLEPALGALPDSSSPNFQ